MSKERVASGIYKLEPGVYDVCVSTGRRPDGKYGQATKRIRGTLAQAKTERGRMLAKVADGKVSMDNISLAELHERFMAARATLSPRSVEFYEYLWAKLKPLLGDRPVRKLRSVDLDRAYAAMLKTGVTANTTAKAHKHLVALLQQAMKWEIVHRNVAQSATPPAFAPFEATPPSEVDLLRLIEAASADEWQFGALVYLGATTGARKGELVGLRWGDVDLDDASIRLKHQPDGAGGLRGLKSKRGRTVMIDDGTVGMLETHKVRCHEIAGECGGKITDSCFVFSEIPGNTEHYRIGTLDARFAKVRKQVGLKVRLHDLRHFQATTLLAKGIAPQVVAARLGHANATITMRTYAHSDAAQERKAAELGGLTPHP